VLLELSPTSEKFVFGGFTKEFVSLQESYLSATRNIFVHERSRAGQKQSFKRPEYVDIFQNCFKHITLTT
jgi:hypothetical protein